MDPRFDGSGVFKLRIPPFIRIPPLVIPESVTRGGILKKGRLFLRILLFFIWKYLHKTVFLQGKSCFGRSTSSKFSPAAGYQHITYNTGLFLHRSTVEAYYTTGRRVVADEKTKFSKTFTAIRNILKRSKIGILCRRRRNFFDLY